MTPTDSARILVVDDDERVRSFLKELLEEANYRVELVEDGPQAIKAVEVDRPDLVLLDVVMPDLGGLEVLRILKAPTEARFLPIILLTGNTDMDTRLRGLKMGADDYLTKPANGGEVLARIEALLRIKRLQDQIADSRRELEDAALTDPATGLYNLRYMETRLKDEFKRAERYNEPLSCLLLEIHGLLAVKDVLDSQAYGELLSLLASLIRSGVREFDVVVRNGPERFSVLLPRTHFAGSMAVAGRLWKGVHSNRFQFPAPARKLEPTLGVAFYPDRDVATARQLTEKSELALTRAIAQGPGQICLYQQTAYFFRPDQGE